MPCAKFAMIPSRHILGNAIMSKQLLIFDLDGTLIDSVPDLTMALNAALTQHQLHACTVDEVRTFVGNGAYNLCLRAATYHDTTVSQALIDAVHHSFLGYYRQFNCIATVTYEGVVEGLKTLKAHNFRLALATNKPERFVPEILEKLQLTGFEMIVGGDSLPTKKPDPLPLLHICHTLGVAPEHALMIGDSKNDIQAGKNANISTFALSYGYNHGEPIEDSQPDRVFHRFDELVAALIA